MPTQLTLWPMSIPIIPMEEYNDFLKEYDFKEMSVCMLKCFLEDLVHDYELCKDMKWADENKEAIAYIRRVIKNREHPNCPLSGWEYL